MYSTAKVKLHLSTIFIIQISENECCRHYSKDKISNPIEIDYLLAKLKDLSAE